MVIKDGWEFDKIKAEDTVDGKKENTEELVDDDKKTIDTEDGSNINSTTGREDGEMEKKSRRQVDRIQRNKRQMESWRPQR